MRTRVFVGVMVAALAVVLSVGVLLASNMAFKLNKLIFGLPPSGTAKIGVTALALPYLRPTGMNNAKDLALDLGCTRVSELRRYVEATNGLQTYRCQGPAFGVNFSLSSGEGYFVVAKNVPDYSYIAAGSHDPAFAVPLEGTPASKIGRNVFAMPYHFAGANAKDLALDIGCTNISEVRRYVSTTNGLQTYRCTGPAFGVNFGLVLGESYDVIAKAGVAVGYVPSHY